MRLPTLILVSVLVLGLPAAGQDGTVPSTGERKLVEFGRESSAPVTSAIPAFMDSLAEKVNAGEATYQAMKQLVPPPSPLKGLGGKPLTQFDSLHHVLGAKSFFDHNVSVAWKDRRAAELRLDSDSAEFYQAWRQEVTNGGGIPPEMVAGQGASTISYPLQWWSPDPQMARRSSKTLAQGNDDYFAICHIVSLAPEWYTDGLIRVSIDLSKFAGSKGDVVRPVSFDGVTSPLWVQRPPTRPAATGSGALETLTRSGFTLADVEPDIAAYLVTPELQKALDDYANVQKLSVDDYSVDLGKVSKDALLGKEQAAIVREVRQARALADQRFEGISKPIELAVSGESKAKATGSAAGPDWKSEMEEWGRTGRVENRGQRFPSERFRRAAEGSPEVKEAILAAATQLLQGSEDPGVLSLVGHLGDGCNSAPFYEALLGRLEGVGKAIPDATGTRNASLREDLVGQLNSRLVAGHLELAPRAHALLEKEGNHAGRLALLHHADPKRELPGVFALVARDKGADPNLLAHAGALLAERHPEAIATAAGHLTDHPEQTTDLFLESIRRVSPKRAQQAREVLNK